MLEDEEASLLALLLSVGGCEATDDIDDWLEAGSDEVGSEASLLLEEIGGGTGFDEADDSAAGGVCSGGEFTLASSPPQAVKIPMDSPKIIIILFFMPLHSRRMLKLYKNALSKLASASGKAKAHEDRDIRVKIPAEVVIKAVLPNRSQI